MSHSSSSSPSSFFLADDPRARCSTPPLFDGKAASYAGWAQSMRAFFDDEDDTWEVVCAPVGGNTALRSVLGGNRDSDVIEPDQQSLPDSPSLSSVTLRKIKRAHRLILLAISKAGPDVQSYVEDVPLRNPHELWTRLERQFTRRTTASKT